MSLNHDPGISGYDVSDGAARAMRARRTGLIATVTILLAMMAWQMRSVDRLEPYRTDSSFYQVLAHNLAEGRGYVFDA